MRKSFIFLLVFMLFLTLGPTFALGEAAALPARPPVDFTPFLQALMGLLAALISAWVIPWIKSKTTAEQQRMLQTAVQVAVYAAEQMYGAGKGREKKAYVETYLQARGFKVDVDLIEATVRELTIKQDEKVFTIEEEVTVTGE